MGRGLIAPEEERGGFPVVTKAKTGTRRFPRYEIPGEAMGSLLPAGVAEMTKLGIGGAALRHAGPLAGDRQGSLTFRVGRRTFTARCRVVYVRPLPPAGESCEVGVEFVRLDKKTSALLLSIVNTWTGARQGRREGQVLPLADTLTVDVRPFVMERAHHWALLAVLERGAAFTYSVAGCCRSLTRPECPGQVSEAEARAEAERYALDQGFFVREPGL